MQTWFQIFIILWHRLGNRLQNIVLLLVQLAPPIKKYCKLEKNWKEVIKTNMQALIGTSFLLWFVSYFLQYSLTLECTRKYQ